MATDGSARARDLEQWLATRRLTVSWNGDDAPTEGPPYPPFLWKWAHIEEATRRVGPALEGDPELNARMAGYKHFGLEHPGLPPGTSPTINMSGQVLTPGELGEARRHMQAEFRFVVRGSARAYAIVEGERFPMEDGDLLGTPAWTWYDWANEGDESVCWLNFGDIPLTRLAFRFREVHPRRRQPIDRPAGYWERACGLARPVGAAQGLATPPFRYPWARTAEALRVLVASGRAPDPVDGHCLTFPHPLTGGPTSPTLAFGLQLLPAGFKGATHRHSCTTRYHVVQGTGATVADGQRLEWSDRDCFIVPPWSWHRHECTGSADAILLSATDRPIVQALGLYREERPDR